ncbi:phage tail tape measure protein [Clostridium botulinum]|uniref:phage tail tape measure protein n=1 Tax=Clostridium botulinum TaxID=1491 RepID=UPI0005F9A562|nr:phage tail tape measure protein [Clostridium botulinum]MBY6799548.1 phage tail tape measure protein [Clostridium botulinum]NFF20895.1 phage tail tape measure protein [Clostridium botulinum]NFM75495.1 phage tail tape measure protein [Clostridium botulinum]NFP81047.1 phage tail tape measure protein [Clostridium botulinum]NFP94019.1 phage tail tape measure protein [Clostridium botulinum]
MASKTIGVVLSLQDKMSSGLLKVNKNVQGVSKEAKRASQQVANFATKAQKGFEKAGDKVLKFGLGLATLAGGLIVKTGVEGLGELDQGARKVKSIAQDSLQLKNIQSGLLKTSNDTGIAIKELADTQYDAISSGVAANESIQAAVTSAKLAKAGFSDSNSSLKILTSTMNVYGLTGQKAMQSISDKLLVTQNLGVTTVGELANSMGSLTPIAKSAGSSIDEMLAGMASLTKNGLKTEEAVTSLKSVFSSVIKPTEEASKTAQQLGIDFSASALKSKGFAKFLEEIKVKTGGNTETMGKLFGNVNALSGALVLTGKGFGDFNTSLDAMKNSVGLTDKAFDTMNNSLLSKCGKMKNRFKNMTTGIMQGTGGQIGVLVDNITGKLKQWQEDGTIENIANKVADGFMKMYDVLSKVFSFIAEHKDAIANFGIAFASLYTAVKIANLLKDALIGIRGAFILVDGALKLTTFGWVVLAIAGVIAIGLLLWKNWDKIKQAASNLWTAIKTVFTNIWTTITTVFTNIWTTITTVASNIWTSITTVFTNIWTSITTIFTNIWTAISTVLTSIWTTIVTVFTTIWNVIVTILTPIGLFIEAVFKGILAVIILVGAWIWNSIVTMWTNVWSVIQPILTAIWNVITTVWTAIWTTITTIATAIWNTIVNVWNTIAGVVSTVMSAIWGVISSIWSTIYGTVSGIMSSIWSTITDIWNNIVSTVSDIVGNIASTISDGFNALIGICSDIFNNIKNTVMGIFEGIWDGIKSIINGGIDMLNNFIGGVNKVISKANKVPGVNIGEVGTIPHFAKGTQYSPAGMALINEEGGELRKLSSGETIIPADKSRQLMSGNLSPEINIYITGNVGTEEFFDQAGQHIISQVRLAMQNM